MNKIYFLIPFLFIFPAYLIGQNSDKLFHKMDNVKMGEILRNTSESVEGIPGNWQIVYGEQILFIITDEAHNRMRIFTPIAEQEEIGREELEKMLEANFHAALDAKYALYGGFVVSLFTHPLGELTPEQFKDALKQVAVAGQNFGTTYSSTDLIFGGNQEAEESNKDKKINKKPSKKS